MSVLIGVVVLVFYILGMWFVFEKAGKEPVLSLIPFLNTWEWVDLSWNSTMAWVVLILFAVITVYQAVGSSSNSLISGLVNLISIVYFILRIITTYKFARAFGKGIGFFLGLLFLPFIFTAILGWGDSRYQGRQNGDNCSRLKGSESLAAAPSEENVHISG